MESKIHILQPELANRIAAGEVVQRPASAVKELLENSLDAKARNITVIVKAAGMEIIQVADDGEGMSEEDALMAFQRHATSKITRPEDLEEIRTLGFRGEALASIAAVAQVELKTRTKEEDVGTLVRIDGNEVKEQTKTSAPVGTSIVVRNLFFNTPARRNFLKSRQTELKNITDAVTRIALAYPEVGFQYISDDEELFNLKPATSAARLRDLFGEKQANGVITVREHNEVLSLEGFVGRPDFARKQRVEQYLFLNRRSIVNRAIQHAVFQAYEHLLEHGTYPFYVLNLTIDPRCVDVNVHPSKLEVKFENESQVYRFVYSAVKRTLAANDLLPSMSLEVAAASPETARLRFGGGGMAEVTRPHVPPGGFHAPSPNDQIEMERVFRRIESQLDEGLAVPSSFTKELPREKIVQHQPTRPEPRRESEAEARAIWQIHNKYILSQIRTGLLIVDQHVAHERILYEKVLSNFENSLPSSQQLLFPQTLELSPGDYQLVGNLLEDLKKLGFDIKLFGKNTVVIEGIPGDVRVGNESKILQDLLDEYKHNEHDAKLEVRENLAKSFACKAAIKAGDKLNTSEMISLIDQLFATSMPYVCPHGRPVVVKIPIEELDRRFGRT